MIPAGPPTRIGTRSVKGRAANPYRGTTNEEPHLAREPAPARPLAEIEATLAAIPNVKIRRTANRFDVRRGPGEALVIACREYAGHLALADLTLVGNEFLAILAVEALVPLFGPIEFTIAEYRDLVDDSEPGVAYARYQQYRLELAQKHQHELAKHAKAVDAARLALADNLVLAAPRSHSPKLWAGVILFAIAATIVAVWAIRHYTHSATGSSCVTDGECRDGECLRQRDLWGEERGTPGVCTKTCFSDENCPDDMRCRPYRAAYTHEARDVCTPKSWGYLY